MPARPSPEPKALRPRPHRPLPYRRVEPVPPAARSLRETVTALVRQPALLRRAGIGAIAAGTAVFVAAGVVMPDAGAGTQALPPAPSAATTSAGTPSADTDPLSYLVRPVITTKDAKTGRHHAARHDTSPAAISGLAANGIPTVALNAYRVAAARMADADPGCGIDWAMLAGIGRVESDHGRFGGAVLRSDGTSSPRIIGPALNGHGTALIPAPSDGAALDGDAVYTHALGPMQFIPQTWAGYGADADGDGSADIFDLDDAALGAARYLCAAGGDLRSHDGQVRAVLAYNHVTWYVNEVLALADAYRRGIPISGIPIGKLTGKLPPVKKPKNPASAGNPPASGGGSHGGKKASGGSGGGSGGGTSAPPGSSGSSSSSSAPRTSSSAPTSTSGAGGGGGQSPTSSSAPRPSASSTPRSSSAPQPSPSSSSCAIGLGSSCIIP